MNKKITIGLFIDTFFPMVDGVIMVVDNYAKRLMKYANVVVFAPEYPGTTYDDSKFEYKVVRCKSLGLHIIDYSLPIPKLDKKFMKKLNEYKLDIVHIHSPFSLGKVGIDYAKKHNIPVIGTMHSQFEQDFRRAVKLKSLSNIMIRIIIKQFNRCDECWAVNREVGRIFYEEYKYKKMPKVMNNATDMLPIKEDILDLDIFNNRYKISEEEKVFLFVGRINKLKNIFFIVDSLKIVKEKSDIKFKMFFIGTGQDEKELKQKIEKENMENEIILCGKVTDRKLLAKYYKRADLFLFPSLYDASSIVQIEAASQNTPTLFLENSATSSTIKNNINGFISKNDINIYADRILEIMNDVELYNKVSTNAFKQIYVNWDENIKSVYDNYVDILKNKEK